MSLNSLLMLSVTVAVALLVYRFVRIVLERKTEKSDGTATHSPANDNRDNLDSILRRIPPNTPFFLDEELLTLWFPPWKREGDVDSTSIEAARHEGAVYNCVFEFDEYMGAWCFVKRPNMPRDN